ncbi:L-rhamnose 1-dehydrogenase [Aureobasidium pullulans]|uniref:L-rhamnose 1-dehydrogenase n=1 Tax=Aureobasidium pullulans TaxID=5580 RepID=A0AB38LL10_AURPU|nr:L-rhamnose 1-dehydrogenase [Aureobasidium pullulans]THZ42334.1 L-rhamnose 1-dehydrogenase [Aureobasidium pullulans]
MSPFVPDINSPVLSQFSLQGKTVAVTGGSGGIGTEVVRGMAEAGANVAIIHHSSVEAESIAASFSDTYNVKVQAYKSDVRSAKPIADTINQIEQDFGHLDVVIANAGVCSRFDALEYDTESWNAINSVNYDGVFWTAKAAGEIFKKQGKGNLVITASVSATLVNVPQWQAAYNASKAAAMHLCKCLAVEWAPFARVNSVSPGYINTLMVSKQPAELMEKWLSMVPCGRIAQPAELKSMEEAGLELASRSSRCARLPKVDKANKLVQALMAMFAPKASLQNIHVSLTSFTTRLTNLGIPSVDSPLATLLTNTPARHEHTIMATFPNAMLLAGKVCAITGGVSGIGRAIAIEYSRQGGAVAVNHLGDDKSTELFKSLKADVPKDAKLIGIGGDIGKPQTGTDFVKATVSEFGSLDVFVANAGVSVFHDFLTTDEKMFESHLHVNTRGTFWSVQAAARQMVAQGRGGSIIGVASISALLGGKQQVHYTPTKASVLSMMQSAACALAEHKIRCNALLPGHTRTPMSADDLAKPEKLKAVNERIPLGHVAEPHDMAGPAVFLASDMSSYVTGAQLLVDGGLYVNLQ